MKLTTNPQVLIAGGSGTIGRHLKKALEEAGYRVVVLSRQGNRAGFASWNPELGQIDEEVLANSEILINLAGENIAGGRWTQRRREQIRTSRQGTTAFLAKVLNTLPNKIHTVIQASAVGYYGDTGAKMTSEDTPASEGFLGTTCAMWEAAANSMRTPMRRLIVLRLGIVLSMEAGYLAEIRKAARLGVLPVFGQGNQYISWVHPADISGFVLHALQNRSLSGPFNLAGPEPETNYRMAQIFKSVTASPSVIFKIPAAFMRIGMGDLSELLLQGQRVSSQKIQQTGYRFRFQTFREAISDLLK